MINKTPEAPSTKSNEPRKRSVLIVEDHPATRRGLAVLVEQQNDLTVCGEADNAPSAIEHVQKLAPDLAVVDLTLKTTGGLELLKQMRVLRPKMKVLVMSMHDERVYAERVLRAGASGYVMKQESSHNILASIRRVLAGEFYLSEEMKAKMLHRAAGSRDEEEVFSTDALTDRELEIFQLIGDGYDTRRIADDLNLSVKTIESHREQLKSKLSLKDSCDLVQCAVEWGRTSILA